MSGLCSYVVRCLAVGLWENTLRLFQNAPAFVIRMQLVSDTVDSRRVRLVMVPYSSSVLKCLRAQGDQASASCCTKKIFCDDILRSTRRDPVDE